MKEQLKKYWENDFWNKDFKEVKIQEKSNFSNKDYIENSLYNLEKIIAVLRLIPFDLGGLIIKSRHSETRRIAIKLIEKKLNKFPLKKIYPEIADSKLHGGIDFSETLRLGKLIHTKSIFEGRPKTFKLMMGERLDTSVAGIFAQKMDAKPNFLMLVIDEGIEDEDAVSYTHLTLPTIYSV